MMLRLASGRDGARQSRAERTGRAGLVEKTTGEVVRHGWAGSYQTGKGETGRQSRQAERAGRTDRYVGRIGGQRTQTGRTVDLPSG